MAYTTINKSTDYFNTKLYTGNGGTNALTGVGFQPDWVWIKNRTSGQDHQIYDAVRGVNKKLESNNTDAEATLGGGLQAFGTDGFTLGDHNESNDNGDNYASWNWKANGAVSNNNNNDGQGYSTVSANTTAGFSIVKYTGTGSNTNFGHGLGVAPKMIIVKNLSSTGNWVVYNENLGNNKAMFLDLTDASATSTGTFNSTSPTSSVFYVGSASSTNGSGNNLIAYCFAEKSGYSKFGSYTGNGSADGTFIYTGFKPAYTMVKRTDAIGDWIVMDTKRSAFNLADNRLIPNIANPEQTSGNSIDILSNGFKNRTSDGYNNGNGGTYVYMAFAEAPLVGTNNVPCTAR